jgi:hypothetical protein
MADIKISQLPAAAAALGTQEFEVNESGTSKKVTGSQVEAFITGNLQPTLDAKVDQTGDNGSAVIPTGTEAQRDASPLAGYFRFNNEISKFEGYNGSAWGSVGGGATGGGSDEIFIENGQVVTTDYTIPADRNAMTTGPIDINSGVTVTVSSGARWVII